MIKGGLSYEALKYGSSTDSPHSDDLTYDKDGGIGLLPGIVTDSHFRYVSNFIFKDYFSFTRPTHTRSVVIIVFTRGVRPYVPTIHNEAKHNKSSLPGVLWVGLGDH